MGTSQMSRLTRSYSQWLTVSFDESKGTVRKVFDLIRIRYGAITHTLSLSLIRIRYGVITRSLSLSMIILISPTHSLPLSSIHSLTLSLSRSFSLSLHSLTCSLYHQWCMWAQWGWVALIVCNGFSHCLWTDSACLPRFPLASHPSSLSGSRQRVS